MTIELPNPNVLYHTFFRPWYPEEHTFEYPGISPDLEEIELPKGTHIRVINRLDPEGQQAIQELIDGMRTAAHDDFSQLLKVEGEPSRDWIDAFEERFTPQAVQELLQQSNPEEYQNAFLILCIETGCLIAEILQQEQPGIQWIHDHPYWDSYLFDLNSMTRMNVFHWAIKRLSSDAEKETLGKKIDSVLKFIREGGIA
jgi:hypothetical protein